jgi:hypothetical protein
MAAVLEQHASLRESLESETTKLGALAQYFQGLNELFSEQRDLLLKSIDHDFDTLIHLINERRRQTIAKVRQTFDPLVKKY